MFFNKNTFVTSASPCRFSFKKHSAGEEKTEYTYDNDSNVKTVKSYQLKDSSEESLAETETTPEYELVSETEYTYSGGLLSETVSTEYEEDVTTNTLTQHENGNVKYEEIKTTTVTETEGTTVTTDKNTYAYDAYGNNTTLTTVSKTDSEAETVTNTEYEYDSLGRAVRTTVLNETSEEYVYDPLGNVLLEKTTDENNETQYTRNLYDAYGRAVQEISSEYYSAEKDSILKGSDTYSGTDGHLYEYNEQTGNLESETNELGVKTDYTYLNGIKCTECFDIYEYDYDSHENIVDIWVSKSRSKSPYAHYEYDENNLNTSITYGNGQTVIYQYDDDGNIISQSYKELPNSKTNLQFEYFYSNGELDHKIDYENNRVEWYENETTSIYTLKYGENNELLKDNFISSYQDLDYEDTSVHKDLSQNSTVISTYSNNNDEYETNIGKYCCTYSSSDDENSSTSILKDSNDKIILKYNYIYDGGNVSKYTVNTSNYKESFIYKYDKQGNIISYGSEKDGKINDNDCVRYYYDNLNHTNLIREDDNRFSTLNDVNNSCSTKYEYDNRGNLTSADYYSYSTEELLPENKQFNKEFYYRYDNNVWIDGVANVSDIDNELVYDENGNPISVDDLEFNWINGRLLSSITYVKDGEVKKLLSYTYDDNGIRTSKTYGDKTTHYITVDGTIMSQYELDDDNNIINLIEFLYDSNNDIVGFTYNNSIYFYIKNPQGDVTNIVDSNGNNLVNYYYYAWGESCFEDNSNIDLAKINPIRYRGYYLDEDANINLYYLQSRYYKPEWSRFINSDLPSVAQEHKDELNGLNLFAYCCNNPIINIDPTGYSRITQYANISTKSKNKKCKTVNCKRTMSFSGKKYKLVYPKNANEFKNDKSWKTLATYKGKPKFNLTKFFDNLGELNGSLALDSLVVGLSVANSISVKSIKVKYRKVFAKGKAVNQVVLIAGCTDDKRLFNQYGGKTTYVYYQKDSTVSAGMYVDSVKSKYKSLTGNKSPYRYLTEAITVDKKHIDDDGSYYISCNSKDKIFLRPIIYSNDSLRICGTKHLWLKWQTVYTYNLTKKIKTNKTISRLFKNLKRS